MSSGMYNQYSPRFIGGSKEKNPYSESDMKLVPAANGNSAYWTFKGNRTNLMTGEVKSFITKKINDWDTEYASRKDKGRDITQEKANDFVGNQQVDSLMDIKKKQGKSGGLSSLILTGKLGSALPGTTAGSYNGKSLLGL